MRIPPIRPAYRDGDIRQSHTYRAARREEQKAAYRTLKRNVAAAKKHQREQRAALVG